MTKLHLLDVGTMGTLIPFFSMVCLQASQREVPPKMGSWFVGCINQCDLPLPIGQTFAITLQSAIATYIPKDANVEVHPGGSLIIYLSGLSANLEMVPEIKSTMENIWLLLGNAIAKIKEEFPSLEVGPFSSLQHNSGIILSGVLCGQYLTW